MSISAGGVKLPAVAAAIALASSAGGAQARSAGAVRAIEIAGLTDKIRVMGMDGIQPVYDLMRKDNSPYVMSVAYSKKSIAEKTTEVVADVIDGKKVPFRALWTRICLVTKDI